MGLFGAGGWLVLGVILIIVGFLLKSRIVELILDLMGWILIIVGVIAVIVALVTMITGKGRRSGG